MDDSIGLEQRRLKTEPWGAFKNAEMCFASILVAVLVVALKRRGSDLTQNK
jgi:hypothetical protein